MTTSPNIFATLQFGWFIGHCLTISGTLLYLATYRSQSKWNSFWYEWLFLGTCVSFVIPLFENYRKKKLDLNVNALLSNDNVQYLFVALSLFSVLPKITLSILPFSVLSSFHAVSYMRTTLLPALNIPASGFLIAAMGNFVKFYNDKSLFVAAHIEVVTLLLIAIKAVCFKKGYWLAFLVYAGFVKLRYERSSVTRSVLKSWEVTLDGLFSHPNIPVQIKSIWVSFKGGISRYVGIPLTKPPVEKKK